MHARRATQHVHFQPGIIRQHPLHPELANIGAEIGGPGHRLQARVLGESFAGFINFQTQAGIPLRQAGEGRSEDAANFCDLVGVSGGNEKGWHATPSIRRGTVAATIQVGGDWGCHQGTRCPHYVLALRASVAILGRMIYCGIGDEGGNALSSQIAATRELGWHHLEARNVTVPGFPKANLHDLPDAAFELAVRELTDAGVRIYGFASTIGNWAKRIEDPFEITLAEVARAIPRMQRLGTRYVRIMSYKVRDDDDQMEAERFRRMREVTRRFLDAGLQPVHENCMNYGGMSPEHARRLLAEVPGLKWVFDTANPVFNQDWSKPAP